MMELQIFGPSGRPTTAAENLARARQASLARQETWAMSGVAQVGSKTFQDVLDRDPVVVVDFYANWRGPCRIVAPIMEKLATEYDGKAKFTKLDVDDNPPIANQLGIMSIPTLIVFRNGKPAEKFVGAAPAQHYRDIIERVL